MLLTGPRRPIEQKGYTHAMNRVPPSHKIGNKFEQLTNQELDGEEAAT
jgi:hypothetical protein